MNTLFRPRSIKRQITLLVAGVSGAGLLLATLTFLLFEIHATRGSMLRVTEAQAGVVARGLTFDLEFWDAASAEKTLSGLAEDGHIIGACVYYRGGKPIVVYIKAEGYLTPALTAALVRDGLVSWVKYAIVRADERVDPFLDELTQLVDPALIVSGMGEQPAIHHLRDRKLAGFTSGCICVHPALSAQMLAACRAGDWEEADRIRRIFEPLENLRNEINPVRVLHEAVTLAGIADMGAITPLLSGLDEAQRARVETAARDLRPA